MFNLYSLVFKALNAEQTTIYSSPACWCLSYSRQTNDCNIHICFAEQEMQKQRCSGMPHVMYGIHASMYIHDWMYWCTSTSKPSKGIKDLGFKIELSYISDLLWVVKSRSDSVGIMRENLAFRHILPHENAPAHSIVVTMTLEVWPLAT